MNVLVPIFICAVMPIAIVFIIYLALINGDNKRAQVLIKAIEAQNGIDADKLAEALKKPKKSEREVLNHRLLRGCIFSLIGLVFIITGAVNLAMTGPSGNDFFTILIMFGGVLAAIGISYLIVYRKTRKQIAAQNHGD